MNTLALSGSIQIIQGRIMACITKSGPPPASSLLHFLKDRKCKTDMNVNEYKQDRINICIDINIYKIKKYVAEKVSLRLLCTTSFSTFLCTIYDNWSLKK